MIEEINATIEKIIEPFLAQFGIVLVELKVHQIRGKTEIGILADLPRGGINLDQCARFNRAVVEEIDRQNILPDGYIVGVASPGLDRPLKTGEDFLRNIDRPVRFFLGQPVSDRLEFEGTVKAVEGEVVFIETPSGEVRIPLRVINKAKQII